MTMRIIAALAIAVGCAAPAAAREVTITSFDGTSIAASFFPAPGGGRAPTVLLSHGFGNTRSQQGDDTRGDVKALLDAGFNALSWDARGFGTSGGTVMLNDPAIEGRDVQALIDFVARQPEAQIDAPSDPRLGMKGYSYAGDIQIVAAAIDTRIDAIAPAWQWHTLVEGFYLDGAFKDGWGGAVLGLGLTSEANDGGLDPHVRNFILDGMTSGAPKSADIEFWRARDRAALLERITAPTLVLQSTVDTLYPPEHAALNYEALRRRGVPVKMMWFCIKANTSGHGVCAAGSDDDARHKNAEIAWFDRYLKQDAKVDTGPGFEWVGDDGHWYSAADYPLAAADAITATGSGSLALTPGQQSGAGIAATPSSEALTVAIPAPPRAAVVVGRPHLRMTYRGTADPPQTVAYAQLVDTARAAVVGNQATPVALLLDGSEHTVERPLATIAAQASPASQYELQLTSSTSVWSPQRSQGSLEASRIDVTLPVGEPARTRREPPLVAAPEPAPVVAPNRACGSRRRVVIRLRRGLRSARVTVDGRRVRVRRLHGRLTARIDLRSRARGVVVVRVTARTRAGRTVREIRRLRTCR
jgi:ABC-2 type transport system ATP-binding protein